MISENILLDSTIWIKYLRGLDASLKHSLPSLILEGRIYTTEIIILEILRGAKSDKEYKMLQDDFLALPQLTMTTDVWEKTWKTAFQLRKKGVTVPTTDIIIATIAIHYNQTLAHHDKHYEIIGKHTPLKTKKLY